MKNYNFELENQKFYNKLMNLKEKLDKKDKMLCIWENDRFLNVFIRDYKYSNWDIIKSIWKIIDKQYDKLFYKTAYNLIK